MSSICSCSSTTTCSPTVRTPISTRICAASPAAVGRRLRRRQARRRHHLSRSGPARRLSDRVAAERQGLARTRAVGRATADRRARRSWACRAPVGSPSTRVSGSTPRGRNRARSPPSACVWPGVAPCTGSRSNVTTDMAYMREHIVACGIADRPVTSLAEEGVDVVDGRGRRHRRPTRRRAMGRRAERSDRTSPGSTGATTSPRSRVARVRATPSRSGRLVRTPGSSRPV